MTTSVINSDDGLVSGSAGLKTTGGDDGALNIQTNGTTRVAIDSSGNFNFDSNTFVIDAANNYVGIGTSTPTNVKLQINSSSTDTVGTGNLGFAGGSTPLWVWRLGASDSDLNLDRYSGSWQSTPALTVKRDTGNVGINTSSPDGKLDVESSSSDQLFLTRTGVGNYSFGVGASNALQISNSGTERMRIDSSGNVGIGTSSPAVKLQSTIASSGVSGIASTAAALFENSGNADVVIAAGTSSKSRIAFGDSGDWIAGRIDYDHSDNSLRFGTNATAERMRITSTGYTKATSDGNYYGAVGNYHEFNQHIDEYGLLVDSGSASLTNPVIAGFSTRAASSAFTFFRAYSGSGSDTEFILRGDGNAYADGTWNNNGADYAEYFESVTGEALAIGATVVLDGNKVREATNQDPTSSIIGVVRPKEPSKASMVVGNTAWNKWANKYLTDDFDRYIMEDHDVVEWEEVIIDNDGNASTKQHSYESHNIPDGISVPENATCKTHDDKGNKFQHYKLNPAWNPNSEYVNRENRPEWNIIGLVGQVKVLKGQSTNDRWIKMRDVSSSVEEWFIR